ncbi:MAG: SPOR domain-containing protein [Gammaproteobacteria bacterium]|nr:SPOR domain-containing protein [Gammaproteobacteria bacterium]
MKLAIYLLLFANLAWYGWTQWIAPSQDPAATTSAATGKNLLLAHEAAPTPAGGATDLPRDNCLSLGPFIDLTDAARASTLLRESELEPRQRAGEGEVWRGYWVTLGGIPDRAAASDVIARLRRAGVQDAYAMPADGSDVTISLGLFSERQRALRRLDDAKAIGLDPRIVDRERMGRVYWIDVDVVPPRELPDAARLQGEGGRILRLEVKPCSEAGA